MNTNILLKCSCGRRFPFNPTKHRNRDYRICPFCHMRVPVEMPPFVPNKAWAGIKLRAQLQRIIRRRMTRSKKKPTRYGEQLLMAHGHLATAIYVLFKESAKTKGRKHR